MKSRKSIAESAPSSSATAPPTAVADNGRTGSSDHVNNGDNRKDRSQMNRDAEMTAESQHSAALHSASSGKRSKKRSSDPHEKKTGATEVATKRTSSSSFQQRMQAYQRDFGGSGHASATQHTGNAKRDRRESSSQSLSIASGNTDGTSKDSNGKRTSRTNHVASHDDDDDDDDESPDLTREQRKVVQLLAAQAYHLPGNTSFQDWMQYVWSNNHPIFGICCHHPLHPLGKCSRAVALLGLALLGLILTNIIYLASTTEEYSHFNDPLVTVMVGDNTDTADIDTTADTDASTSTLPSAYTITTGMMILWTVGGVLHTVFSLFIWQLSACACCRSGGWLERIACCPSLGKRLARLIVLALCLLATAIVLTRASSVTDVSDHDGNTIVTNEVPAQQPQPSTIDETADDRRNFQFLVGYSVELFLLMFVYYPLGATLLFSGVLGCGRVPVLGGRPRDMWMLEQQRQRKARRQNRRRQRAERMI